MKTLLCFALASCIGYVGGYYFGFAGIVAALPVGLILGWAAAA
jgi:hypothetical protein